MNQAQQHQVAIILSAYVLCYQVQLLTGLKFLCLQHLRDHIKAAVWVHLQLTNTPLVTAPCKYMYLVLCSLVQIAFRQMIQLQPLCRPHPTPGPQSTIPTTLSPSIAPSSSPATQPITTQLLNARFNSEASSGSSIGASNGSSPKSSSSCGRQQSGARYPTSMPSTKLSIPKYPYSPATAAMTHGQPQPQTPWTIFGQPPPTYSSDLPIPSPYLATATFRV